MQEAERQEKSGRWRRRRQRGKSLSWKARTPYLLHDQNTPRIWYAGHAWPPHTTSSSSELRRKALPNHSALPRHLRADLPTESPGTSFGASVRPPPPLPPPHCSRLYLGDFLRSVRQGVCIGGRVATHRPSLPEYLERRSWCSWCSWSVRRARQRYFLLKDAEDLWRARERSFRLRRVSSGRRRKLYAIAGQRENVSGQNFLGQFRLSVVCWGFTRSRGRTSGNTHVRIRALPWSTTGSTCSFLT